MTIAELPAGVIVETIAEFDGDETLARDFIFQTLELVDEIGTATAIFVIRNQLRILQAVCLRDFATDRKEELN